MKIYDINIKIETDELLSKENLDNVCEKIKNGLSITKGNVYVYWKKAFKINTKDNDFYMGGKDGRQVEHDFLKLFPSLRIEVVSDDIPFENQREQIKNKKETKCLQKQNQKL